MSERIEKQRRYAKRLADDGRSQEARWVEQSIRRYIDRRDAERANKAHEQHLNMKAFLKGDFEQVS